MSSLLELMEEEVDSDFGDDFRNNEPTYTEAELLTKLGTCSYQFEAATSFLVKYSATIDARKAKIRAKLLSKSVEMIENEQLKLHLERIFDDPKLRLTKEDIEGFIAIELGDISEHLDRAQMIAKTAEKAHDMWQKQLSWYQSKMRKDTSEMMTLNRQPG